MPWIHSGLLPSTLAPANEWQKRKHTQSQPRKPRALAGPVFRLQGGSKKQAARKPAFFDRTVSCEPDELYQREFPMWDRCTSLSPRPTTSAGSEHCYMCSV